MTHIAYRWLTFAFLLMSGLVTYAAWQAYTSFTLELEQRPVAPWQPDAADLSLDPARANATLQAGPDARERPLFSATRRPFVPKPPEPEVAAEELPVIDEQPPAEEPPQPPPVQVFDPAQFALKGMLAMAGEKRVLVATPDKADGQWMIKGAEINGWKITEIGDGSITLRNSGNDFILKQYVDNLKPGLGSETPVE